MPEIQAFGENDVDHDIIRYIMDEIITFHFERFEKFTFTLVAVQMWLSIYHDRCRWIYHPIEVNDFRHLGIALSISIVKTMLASVC